MANSTFYLKYRPQKVSELDLDEIRETLQKIVASKEIPHAFLFAGPRGSGKTSAARILAKAVNCERPSKSGEPCNRCRRCQAITKGGSLDIIEIDAASHRGVDDIRSLREAVNLAPSDAKKKVYIIDEAHMLTQEAANALLKTLEEPPEHVMFVLATTALEKLPDTIRSRCTILTFRKATEKEIARPLARAIKGEKLKVEKGVIQEIAKLVDGSFRGAHNLLEQLALGRQKITIERVKEVAALGFMAPAALLDYLVKKDAKASLEEIDKVAKAGVNLRVYTSEMVGLLRNLLLEQLGVKEGMDIKVGLKDMESTKELIELFSEAVRAIPTAVIPQLPLELVVVKWCEGEEEVSVSTPSPRNSSPAKGGIGSRDSAASSRRRHPLDPASDNRELHSSTHSPSSGGKVEGSLDEQWQEIMRRIKEKNYSVEALLRATKPQRLDGGKLTIEVFYEFHKERLEREPYRKVVEEAAALVFGIPVQLVCFLSSSQKRAADLVNVSEPDEEDIVKVAEEIFAGNGDDLKN